MYCRFCGFTGLSSTYTSGRYSPLLPRGLHMVIVISETAYDVTQYSVLFVILCINVLLNVVNTYIDHFLK